MTRRRTIEKVRNDRSVQVVSAGDYVSIDQSSLGWPDTFEGVEGLVEMPSASKWEKDSEDSKEEAELFRQQHDPYHMNGNGNGKKKSEDTSGTPKVGRVLYGGAVGYEYLSAYDQCRMDAIFKCAEDMGEIEILRTKDGFIYGFMDNTTDKLYEVEIFETDPDSVQWMEQKGQEDAKEISGNEGHARHDQANADEV